MSAPRPDSSSSTNRGLDPDVARRVRGPRRIRSRERQEWVERQLANAPRLADHPDKARRLAVLLGLRPPGLADAEAGDDPDAPVPRA